MSSESPASAPVSVQPLACPGCAAAIPLGEGDTATCPYCKTKVPVPEEHRTLRATRLQDLANRRDANRAFELLGSPPGPLMRAWTQVAGVAGGVLGLIVAGIIYVGGLLAFVSIFLLEFIAHWMARLLTVDLADHYGGFGLYFRFALIVVVGIVLPVVLGSSYDAFTQVRRTLQAGLMAQLPKQAGGPSLCRSCGAPLDVPEGALGVTCTYCAADNLVALPPAWVRKLAKQAKSQKQHVEAAMKDLLEQRGIMRAELQMVVIVGVVGVPLFGLVGKIATAVDYDTEPPTWAETTEPQRHFVIEEKPVAPGEPFTFGRRWSSGIYAGLNKGEVVTIQSADVASLEARAHSNTTFPIGEWTQDLEPHLTPAGESAVDFKAPYRGVFRIWVTTSCARVEACTLQFLINSEPSPTGRLADPPLTRHEWKQDGGVQGLAWSPDGKRLATAGANHDAVLWDPSTSQPVLTLSGHTGVIQAVAFSPDGTKLATASVDNSARIWAVDGGMMLDKLTHPDAMETLAWRPDGTLLATAGKGGEVYLWDTNDFEAFPTRKAHTDTVMSLAWSADGKRLASGSFDHRVIVWDVEADALVARLDGDDTAFALLFVPQRPQTLATAEKGHGALWELEPSPYFRGPMIGHTEAAYSISATPDGKVLATGAADQTVRLWDSETGRLRYVLGPLGTEVNGVAFRPDGRVLAAGLKDGRVILWETSAGW